MKPQDKAPARAIDWAAIRLAYEAGDEPMRMIADRHCSSISAIDHRRRRDGWPLRRDRARQREAATDAASSRLVNWDDVRREYEGANFSIWEICARHAIAEGNLYRRRREENWPLRRQAFPRAFGAGGAGDTTARLRALVEIEVAKLQADGQVPDKINVKDPLRALHTVLTAFHKLREIETLEKGRIDADRIHHTIISDASRLDLAGRLATLAEAWENGREPAPSESSGPGGA